MRSLETIFGKNIFKNLELTVKAQILINFWPNIAFKMVQHVPETDPNFNPRPRDFHATLYIYGRVEETGGCELIPEDVNGPEAVPELMKTG